MLVTRDLFNSEKLVNLKESSSEKCFGNLPLKVQEFILSFLSQRDLVQASGTCHWFFAERLKLQMERLAHKTKIVPMGFRSKEQEEQVTQFFNTLRGLPHSVVFPERYIRTIPQMRRLFLEFWEGIRYKNFSDPLTDRLFKFENGEYPRYAAKFLHNLPACLVGFCTSQEIQEISYRLENGHQFSELDRDRCFRDLRADASGFFSNFYDPIFRNLSLKSLEILMKIYGNQFRFDVRVLERFFRNEADQQLACKKFIILANSCAPHVSTRYIFDRNNMIEGLFKIGFYFHKTQPRLVSLEKFRSWIPADYHDYEFAKTQLTTYNNFSNIEEIHRNLFKQ